MDGCHPGHLDILGALGALSTAADCSTHCQHI
jgi:hypothetical protein